MSVSDLNVGLILCVIVLFLWLRKLSQDVRKLRARERYIFNKGYEEGLQACSDSTQKEDF